MGADECCFHISKKQQKSQDIGSQEQTCCYWCALKISRKDTIGIPMKIDRCKNAKLISNETQEILYKCSTYGSFCCFGCAYAFLKTLGNSELSVPLVFSSAISNLRLLFGRCHPGKELKASPNRIYHKRYGGILDDKSYYSGKYRYNANINLIFVPVCITGTILKT